MRKSIRKATRKRPMNQTSYNKRNKSWTKIYNALVRQLRTTKDIKYIDILKSKLELHLSKMK